jgi:hypothetical protein
MTGIAGAFNRDYFVPPPFNWSKGFGRILYEKRILDIASSPLLTMARHLQNGQPSLKQKEVKSGTGDKVT